MYAALAVMILNSLQNNRFGLEGGTPQLHQPLPVGRSALTDDKNKG